MLESHIGDYFTISVFDVLLPTLDTSSDISLAASWYLEGNTTYAAMMSLPPTLNYCFAWYEWWSNEKISRMKWSWIFVLFNLYHQINAISVLKAFWNNDNLDAKKKQKTLSKVSFLEPYLESAPTVIILGMIWCSALTGNGIETFGYMAQDYNAGYFDCKNVSASWTKWEANDYGWPSPKSKFM